MGSWFRLAGRLARLVLWIFAWPFLSLVGLAVVLGAVGRAVRRASRLRSVAREFLACPQGHGNSVLARWECSACGGQYLGWVGRCSACGDETAAWFECEVCRLAVVLPWRRG